MVYLENTEQNLTTLGRGVHYYVLRKCCYFSCRFAKQTPDPSIQFLVNMQTTDKFNADEQLRIGWPYANANWFQIRYIIFFQETLKRWYGNVLCMFILRSLTGLVTFWAHRKFKIVASGGQSLLWNNADEQLRIGWPYANANWFQIRYENYNGFKFDLMIRFQYGIRVNMVL
jgi:hypothetical protein